MHDWNFTDRKMTDLGIGSPVQLYVGDKLIILVARTAYVEVITPVYFGRISIDFELLYFGRIAVKSQSNRRCNHRIRTMLYLLTRYTSVKLSLLQLDGHFPNSVTVTVLFVHLLLGLNKSVVMTTELPSTSNLLHFITH